LTLRISVLPTEVIQRIASGEVIDSPVAAVRELVENALDAEATAVEIDIDFDAGNIVVRDNGRGMRPNDLERCLQQNATSKLASLEQLVAGRVHTLGFRGQGLWAISQLCACIEVRSKGETSPCGYMIQYSPQQVETKPVEPVGLPQGTIVQVTGLFCDEQFAPRRSAMPHKRQLRQQLLAFVRATALCHPNVSWRVRDSGRNLLTLYGKLEFSDEESETERAKHALIRMFSQIMEIAPEECGAFASDQVLCVLGYPDRGHHRSRADAVIVAVNGRAVQNADLVNAALSHVQHTLPSGRFPIIFIHIRCPGRDVDWNIHPMKTMMRLRDPEYWFQKLREGIDRCFSMPLSEVSAADLFASTYLRKLIDMEEGALNGAADEPQSNQLLRLEAMTQIGKTYIIATNMESGDIWIIEQHTAHERVLYEKYRDQYTSLARNIVELREPIIMRGLFAQAQVEELRESLGIHMTMIGPLEWKVERAPQMFIEAGPLDPENDCPRSQSERKMQFLLQALGSASSLEDRLALLACRAAVKNGTQLDRERMQSLVDQWLRTKAPRTCPHGRPTFRQLTTRELEIFFRRRYTPQDAADSSDPDLTRKRAPC